MRTASAEAMVIVKSTAPALEKHGLAITTAMYARLFQNRDIEAMFDRAAQDSGEQPKRLAGAIIAYARNIDKLPNLGPAVSRMVARHLETGVKPDHYPHVAEALLPAIREVLGDEVATDEAGATQDQDAIAHRFTPDLIAAGARQELARARLNPKYRFRASRRSGRSAPGPAGRHGPAAPPATAAAR